jgi:hypothetical protein
MVETTLKTPSTFESNSAATEITSCKLKPRAIIFKANDKDLSAIKDLIESQFTKVEIIYITTGPASCILKVTKSMPLETPSALAPFFSIE